MIGWVEKDKPTNLVVRPPSNIDGGGCGGEPGGDLHQSAGRHQQAVCGGGGALYALPRWVPPLKKNVCVFHKISLIWMLDINTTRCPTKSVINVFLPKKTIFG